MIGAMGRGKEEWSRKMWLGGDQLSGASQGGEEQPESQLGAIPPVPALPVQLRCPPASQGEVPAKQGQPMGAANLCLRHCP